MVRLELRVVLAVIATSVALGGIAVAIRGLLFDQSDAVLGGVAGIVVGVFGCAVLLNTGMDDIR
jgi:membrane associated rhomboid family serine protease